MKVERKIRTYYRLIEDDPKHIETKLEQLSNLIISFGGRIYGTNYQMTTIGTPEHWIHLRSVLMSFEIPIENKEAFEKDEKQ